MAGLWGRPFHNFFLLFFRPIFEINVCRVLDERAHDEATLFRRVARITHGKVVCRVPDKMHTTKPVCRQGWLPSGFHREPHMAKNLPCV